jgi:hypothetical protein
LITFVYVDGFNLYNRAVKNSPYKWLDLYALAKRKLDPSNDIAQIRYFTSWVSGRGDAFRTQRQQTYLRALKAATPCAISFHFGHFLSRPILRPLVKDDKNDPACYVCVDDTREKGSDVNLASNLIWDGAQSAYDLAVVISKDTDLVEPIRIVRDKIKRKVGVLCPDETLSEPLQKAASFFLHIHHYDYAACQFPDRLNTHYNKLIRKPEGW